MPYEPPVEEKLSPRRTSALSLNGIIKGKLLSPTNGDLNILGGGSSPFSESFPVCEIPLGESKTVGYKGVQWSIRYSKFYN